MRWRRRVAGLSLVATTAVLVACGSSGGAGPEVETVTPVELDQAYLAQVADASSRPRSGRFTVVSENRTTFNGRSSNITTTTEGWFDEDAGLTRQVVTGTTEGLATAGSTIPPFDGELIGTRTDWYERGSLTSVRGVPADRWAKVSKRATAGTAGTEIGDTVDPTNLLDQLRRVGAGIEDRGSESIDGVTTRHVHAQASAMDIDRGLGGSSGSTAPPPPGTTVTGGDDLADLDVYIDGDNRVRRMVIAMTTTDPFGSGGPAAAASGTVTIDFYDYDRPVTITVPRDEETVDGTVLLQGTSSAGAGSVPTTAP